MTELPPVGTIPLPLAGTKITDPTIGSKRIIREMKIDIKVAIRNVSTTTVMAGKPVDIDPIIAVAARDLQGSLCSVDLLPTNLGSAVGSTITGHIIQVAGLGQVRTGGTNRDPRNLPEVVGRQLENSP